MIREKRRGKLSKGILLQQDNARVHTCKIAMDAVERNGYETRGRVNNNQPIPFPMDRDGHDFHALFQYMFYTWVQNCTRVEDIECQTWLMMQRHAFHLKLSTVL